MFGTYCRLGVDVGASKVDVIRAAHKRIARKHRRGLTMRAERHKFYRAMLRYHAQGQALYREVMFGDIGAD